MLVNRDVAGNICLLDMSECNDSEFPKELREGRRGSLKKPEEITP